MTQLRQVFTTEANNVPEEYTKTGSTSKSHQVLKGQLNTIRIRPQILNEHAESSRELMDTVNSTTIVGQIFKASQDNINGVMLTMESAAGASLDNFESYAASGDLQAVWVLAGSNLATLETTIVKTGAKSMRLPLDALSDEWQDTVSSVDYTGYTFDFNFLQDAAFSVAEVAFFIGDGSNTKSISLPIAAILNWEHFDINEAAMSDDGGTPPTMTTITEIGFRVDKKKAGASAYIDDLVATPPPGQVELKLWDLGASLPVGDGASFDLATDASQYTELGDRGINDAVAASIFVDLQGGRRLYSVAALVAGVALEIPSNTLLTPNNYYALTINYVDTDVNVYGPNTTFSTNYYTNGYAFYTTAENVDITTIAGAAGAGSYSDLAFGIFSTQDIYITSFFQFLNAVPGSATETSVYVEDSSMGIEAVITHGTRAVEEIFAELGRRPYFMEKGGKFEQHYNDDFTDSVTGIGLTMGFLYVPPTVNG